MKTRNLICAMLCSTVLFAQKIDKEVILTDGNQFLLGRITIDALTKAPYNHWYEPNFNNYEVEKVFDKRIQRTLKKYALKLFLGTWCGDSKKQVPRIIKILAAANFPMDQLEIVALDSRKLFYKTSPNGEEKGLNIIRVPTLIFMKNGKEVNRIVESPIESLESDIVAILSAKAYVPNYSK